MLLCIQQCELTLSLLACTNITTDAATACHTTGTEATWSNGVELHCSETVTALNAHLDAQGAGCRFEASLSDTAGYIKLADGAKAKAQVYNTAKQVLESAGMQYAVSAILASTRGQFRYLPFAVLACSS
jgi:hypothetical protein